MFSLRISLFFAGFHWIRIVDQRRNDCSILAPIICAAPHSTFFDILLILKLRNPTFVSRRENIHTPLIGNILRLHNGIYVDRHDKDSRMATIKAIMERTIEHGEHVLIFPEGTTGNRKQLLQFKLGAFLPRLPIQPVLIRYSNCFGFVQDPITWTWEGPGLFRIFFQTMSCIYIDCEITIMDEYRPDHNERQDPKKFAENVAKKMSIELGIPQSYYSYDDVPLMSVARQFRLFRSPICITMMMENNFQYKIIESSNDIPIIWKLSEFINNDDFIVQILKNIFNDLMKMLQITLSTPITTIHLLIILHLCDLREFDLWERIRTAIRLFDRIDPKKIATNNPYDEQPNLTMNEFQTLLWYSIGLNEFNQKYFLQKQFDYRYLRENLCRLFTRAIHENAPQLLIQQQSKSKSKSKQMKHCKRK
ncbi:hypothetical protein BLA29_004019 [Euroglyphus maynei]|uniref:Phospholipid/glycerol acyltransferase domain-containing protein n=1 Tax=Euroglyphus maynei TaxID=6958 RepID=A0A1Y3BDQ3_EURMA|nr:hypothetical protein BLA29_004019 [Euroglyphus maynei]